MKIRRIIAIILFVFIILPSMCMFQIFAGINSFAFDSNFYTAFLDVPQLYQSLADGMGVDPQLALQMEDGPIRDTLLSATDPASLRQTVMTIANTAINAIIEGENTIPVTSDISSWRDFIVNSPPELQAEFIRGIINSAPNCGFNQTMTQEGYPLPVCVPANISRTEVADAFLEEQEAIVANFPDSITYNIDLDLGGAELGILQLRDGFSGTMRTAGMIALVMCIITTLIFSNKIFARFRWLGLTLIIPSILMIIASLLFSQTILSLLGQGAMVLGTIDNDVAGAVGNGLSRVGWSFFWAGMIPALIGGLLFAYGSNAALRATVQRGKQLGSNSSENVQKAKDGLVSASSKAKDSISTIAQSENTQKAKESVVSAGSKAKDSITNIAQSENTQKAKESVVSAGSKAKDSISNIAQSENTQKAKESVVSAGSKAKDSISNIAQSENTQKAKESVFSAGSKAKGRLGKFTKDFLQKDPADDSILNQPDQQADNHPSLDEDTDSPDENKT